MVSGILRIDLDILYVARLGLYKIRVLLSHIIEKPNGVLVYVEITTDDGNSFFRVTIRDYRNLVVPVELVQVELVQVVVLRYSIRIVVSKRYLEPRIAETVFYLRNLRSFPDIGITSDLTVISVHYNHYLPYCAEKAAGSSARLRVHRSKAPFQASDVSFQTNSPVSARFDSSISLDFGKCASNAAMRRRCSSVIPALSFSASAFAFSQ